MPRVLELKDKTGRTIYLTDERYNHIRKHPEMKNSLQLIEETIRKPTSIQSYSFDPNIKYYYNYQKDRKSKAKHLRVIIKYLNGEGFVITAYFVVNP